MVEIFILLLKQLGGGCTFFGLAKNHIPILNNNPTAFYAVESHQTRDLFWKLDKIEGKHQHPWDNHPVPSPKNMIRGARPFPSRSTAEQLSTFCRGWDPESTPVTLQSWMEIPWNGVNGGVHGKIIHNSKTGGKQGRLWILIGPVMDQRISNCKGSGLSGLNKHQIGVDWWLWGFYSPVP